MTHTMKDARRDMHGDFASVASNLIEDCIEREDGEKCFNLHVFLDRLAVRIESLMECAEGWSQEINRFGLDANQIARYLWACLAIKYEGNAYPSVFKGMPVLD